MTDLHESFRSLLEGEPPDAPDARVALAGGRRALGRRRRRQAFAAVALAASAALTATLLRAALPITTVPPVDGAAPVLVAFERDRTLATVRSDGTQLGDIGDGVSGTHPAWSPDASQLAFVRDDVQGRGDIWVMQADGSDQRLLVDCADPCRYAEDPAYSPDGTQLAYWTNGPTDTTQVIRVVDVATGAVRLTVSAPPLQAPVAPRWSPDGFALVVGIESYDDSAAQLRLSASAIGVIDLRTATPALTAITPFTLLASHPVWAPDGRSILFVAGNLNPADSTSTTATDLWQVAPDGTGLVRLTRRSADDPRLASLDWPRGSPLLVVALVDDLGSSLARMSPDGRAVTPITDPATRSAIPGAAPRGTSLG